MASHLYVQRQSNAKSGLNRILAFSLCAALILAAVSLTLIAHNQKQAENSLSAFQQALAAQDYALALTLYRDVQKRAVTESADQTGANPYRQILDSMEQQVDVQMAQVESRLDGGMPLSASDRALITGLSEVTGVRLSRFVREQCRNFLTGKVSQAALTASVEQLAELENLKETVAPIQSQFVQLTAARPAVQAAEDLLEQRRWYEACAAFRQLADQADDGSFVQDFARSRLDDCRKAMYQPLLTAALQNMEENRTVTAKASLTALLAEFPGDAAIKNALQVCETKIPGKLVPYRGVIEHLVVKPLIADPAVAFDGDAYAAAARDTMLTTTEFSRILEQLYANQYIMVDQTSLLTADGQNFELKLPEGRKPVVLVLDGLNYYVSRRETGNCWDLALNEQGQVCGVIPGPDQRLVLSREAEAIGLVDAFIETHPDFSFDGAKGLITLSGYEGLFGTITDPDQLDDRNMALKQFQYPTLQPTAAEYAQNREKVAAILDRLRQTGWQLGSATYGMINVPAASFDTIRQDFTKWQTQVGILTGPVVSLSFPNGAIIRADDPKYAYYRSQGIRIFTGLGAAPYLVRRDDTFYADKVQLSGYSLEHPDLFHLDRFFNAALVLDDRRKSFSG